MALANDNTWCRVAENQDQWIYSPYTGALSPKVPDFLDSQSGKLLWKLLSFRFKLNILERTLLEPLKSHSILHTLIKPSLIKDLSLIYH